MAKRTSRRRSSRKVRRVAKTSGRSHRKSSRRVYRAKRRGNGLGTTKQVYPNYYGDVAIAKLKDHFITSEQYEATDINTSHTVLGCMYMNLNCNGNNGPMLFAPGTPNLQIATFQPLNMGALRERYAQARPMGIKLRFTISLPDSGGSATPTSTPLCIGWFPYQNYSRAYGNFWNETALPDYKINCDTIGQMKYGKVKRLYSTGSVPKVTITQYFDFAKIVGRTHEQYLSDPNFIYDTSGSAGCIANIKLCICVNDLIVGTDRSYNPEFTAVQYIRMESAYLTPF